MNWETARDRALRYADLYGVKYRVYSVRRPGGGWAWFIYPTTSRLARVAR